MRQFSRNFLVIINNKIYLKIFRKYRKVLGLIHSEDSIYFFIGCFDFSGTYSVSSCFSDYRGVFGILSNISDGAFVKCVYDFQPSTVLRRKLYFRCLTRFWIGLRVTTHFSRWRTCITNNCFIVEDVFSNRY